MKNVFAVRRRVSFEGFLNDDFLSDFSSIVVRTHDIAVRAGVRDQNDVALLARRKQPVRAEAIAGETVAFTTETSTSGSVFPSLQLIEMGLDPATDVNPVFTGGHDAAVTAVYNGDAYIGFTFDDARREIRETNPDVGSKVVAMYASGEIPNDVVAVRGSLPDDLKDAIYDAIGVDFMQLPITPEKILDALEEKKD